MAWGKNGTPTTLGSAGDDMDITDLTANKFNQFMTHCIASGTIYAQCIFNNNTNTVYASRFKVNGNFEYTDVSATLINLHDLNTDKFTIQYWCSISGEEKLGIIFTVESNTAGASNVPNRREEVSKFVPSPDADITRIDINNLGSGNYATGSNLSALGSEGQTAVTAKIQDGLIFEETDTNKHYIYTASTDTWTEI
jgi:hypothetical protein